MTVIDLPIRLRARLSQGHPWVYRTQVPGMSDLASGTWVRVRCGGFSGYGLWDSESSIAIRLVSRHHVPDEAWVGERVEEAWELRAPIRETSTTGYRWIYGEADGLPGVVVDLYADFAVVETFVESADVLVPWVAGSLHAHARLRGVVWRRRGAEPRMLWGQRPPASLVVEENGLLMYADLWAGQKTGLFHDQRDNRLTLAPLCRGRSVLDCFSYTGGFALHAARAGASAVLVVDRSADAIEAAQQNFRLNEMSIDRHEWHVGDGFEVLQELAASGRRFGVVILDPPSLAKDRQSRQAAERAYVRLNRSALGCVEPGGLLASASCTSQVSPEAFREALAEAARLTGKRLQVLHEAGQPIDHPVPVGFPEARYLKFVVSRVLPLA
ncbi:MAG TPA: class I SAM-dependent rRNA methyltransferase [Anaerolineae bacterium]|nr:class I SAM-dependent rRNA methyltransferase [Anaerolineae bacterium]